MTSPVPLSEAAEWGPKLQWTLRSEPLAGAPALSQYVVAFHEWIRQGHAGELLIDVASYEHVPGGPSVLLVGHEVDYSVSLQAECLSLTVRTKRSVDTAVHPLVRSMTRFLRAAERLQDDSSLVPRPTFRPHELTLQSNDRLLHPNDDTTLRQLAPDLQRWMAAVVGTVAVRVRSQGRPWERLSLRVTWEKEQSLDVRLLRRRIDPTP